MSKTAFVILSIIIGFGILSTTVLAFFTGKPLGTMVIGYLIFGILAVVLLIMLADCDYELNDDLKITFNRTVKHLYPQRITEKVTEEGLEDFPDDEFIKENEEIKSIDDEHPY
jgi:hypothetical protein